MYDLAIIPDKSDSKTAEPCCPSPEKPRYPQVTLSGTARDQFIEAIGEEPSVGDEYILKDVRVKVTGRTHNEWSNNIEIALCEMESAVATDEQEDFQPDGEGERGKDRSDSAMDRAVSRGKKLLNGADSGGARGGKSST
jgi:hypothetical protein